MIVRTAAATDGEAIAIVLSRSIRELCTADHQDDECTLRHWLGQKTSATVARWVDDPNQHIIVAENNGRVIGVGGSSADGRITLNYVAPEVRFRGVSRLILATLEERLRAQGFRESSLSSTRTALPFYWSAGYEETGEPQEGAGLVSQPMRKIFR